MSSRARAATRKGDARWLGPRHRECAPVASAAKSGSGELLLRYLTLAGWTVDVRSAAPVGLSAVAVRQDGAEGPRVAVWAKNRNAVALLLFHSTFGRPPLESAYC